MDSEDVDVAGHDLGDLAALYNSAFAANDIGFLGLLNRTISMKFKKGVQVFLHDFRAFDAFQKFQKITRIYGKSGPILPEPCR